KDELVEECAGTENTDDLQHLCDEFRTVGRRCSSKMMEWADIGLIALVGLCMTGSNSALNIAEKGTIAADRRERRTSCVGRHFIEAAPATGKVRCASLNARLTSLRIGAAGPPAGITT